MSQEGSIVGKQVIHKAEHCMNNIDHPFYQYGAMSLCGHFLTRKNIKWELKISLDDEFVTCKKCIRKTNSQTMIQ